MCIALFRTLNTLLKFSSRISLVHSRLIIRSWARNSMDLTGTFLTSSLDFTARNKTQRGYSICYLNKLESTLIQGLKVKKKSNHLNWSPMSIPTYFLKISDFFQIWCSTKASRKLEYWIASSRWFRSTGFQKSTKSSLQSFSRRLCVSSISELRTYSC